MPGIAQSAVLKLAGLVPLPQPPIVRLNYPVVLMHGFGMLGGLRRGGHLHDDAMYLRQHGIWAYAPNVAPYDTVVVRTAMWKPHIELVLEETKCDKINLVAQSMGGLDARYLISKMGLHEHVVSLTTISTPHHGSALANFVLEQPDRLRTIAAELVNWMGTIALEDATADVLTAVYELTPEFMAERFNKDVPDHPSVKYWSYAGATGKGTASKINPFMMPLNAIVYGREGVNDGFVSVESAKWGEFKGTIPADHAQQVGIQVFHGSDFKSKEFYLEVARMLAKAGF
jgi:triacylglycerol lipase